MEVMTRKETMEFIKSAVAYEVRVQIADLAAAGEIPPVPSIDKTTPLSKCGLKKLTLNVMNNCGFYSVGDVCDLSDAELLKFRNFGMGCLIDLKLKTAIRR